MCLSQELHLQVERWLGKPNVGFQILASNFIINYMQNDIGKAEILKVRQRFSALQNTIPDRCPTDRKTALKLAPMLPN